jgi:DNA-binding transcriptional ArsR family regulator
LWRTCRVLANPVRLQVLRQVCEAGEACVSATARACGLPLSSTTTALRALQARGLLGVRREGPFVVYFPAADKSVEYATDLLAALRAAILRQVSDARIIRSMTAFTHVRRILIVRALSNGPAAVDWLSVHCGISRPALYRHLGKLARRGVVQSADNDLWLLTIPGPGLDRDLLALARKP